MLPRPLQVAQPMAATEIKTSTRLLHAAEAEREELCQQRARLGTDRDAALARLREIDRVLADLDERERLLDQLAPRVVEADAESHRDTSTPDPAASVRANSSGAALNASGIDVDADRVLRGPAIRETAVRVLVGRGNIEALHYREWFELLVGEGYTVAGKDGLAVFLTQISRSPVVRKGTQAGVYELDRDAPWRLARELERLLAELRELTGRTRGTTDLAEIRARREQLTSAIGRVERALEETQRVLTVVVDEREVGGGQLVAAG